MKYRTRLALLLASVCLFGAAISATVAYFQFKRMLFLELQSKTLSIAATTAALLDGELHTSIRGPSDENSPQYKALLNQMKRVRDANRRADVNVKSIYTLRRSSENPEFIEFGVDTEENPADFSHVGERYRGYNPGEAQLEVPSVDKQIERDAWGEWLSATAPIRDSGGKMVAALGLDVPAAEIRQKMNRVLLSSGLAMILAFGSGLLLSLMLSVPAAKPFEEMQREKETIKKAFSRYVSQQIINKILDMDGSPILSGERRRVTVMFTDIRGFTALAEKMAPEEVVTFLNEYFARMIDIVFRNHGTLDKFIGDGLMVIFGAPIDDPYQEEHAVRAAIEMRDQVRELSRKLDVSGGTAVRIGIGIHSGTAIVGNIGSETRMEYTAIGDTVNVAARLENATRDQQVDILVSEVTYEAVQHLAEAKDVGSLALRGRSHHVQAYALSGFR